MGIAKLHGLLVDRTEDVTKAQDMKPDELTAELARVQAELDALEGPAGRKVSDKPTDRALGGLGGEHSGLCRAMSALARTGAGWVPSNRIRLATASAISFAKLVPAIFPRC